MTDDELIERLRARGTKACIAVAELMEAIREEGIDTLLEKARAEAVAVGQDPDETFGSSAEAVLAEVRVTAHDLIKS